MSPDARWTLADYIRALVDGVASAEPASALRLRQTVGNEVARITLDDETVLVRFEGERLVVAPAADETADGAGATDRATVLDLLAARTELTDAVLTGRLELTGPPRSITRICQAIEILLDVSARAPGLQALADRYRAESPASPGPAPGGPPRDVRRTVRQAEHELLARLGLLREA